VVYRPRQAVYACLVDAALRVACVRSDFGLLYLPGGGMEAGETPQEALARELREEIGHRLERATEIGCLRELYTTPNGQKHYDQTSRYYRVETAAVPAWSEAAETTLLWIEPETFAAEAAYQSHVEAVRRFGPFTPRS
jgi:8-oxo-dGTP diphosphatase